MLIVKLRWLRLLVALTALAVGGATSISVARAQPATAEAVYAQARPRLLQIRTLAEPLDHYVYRDVSDMLRRLDRYTSAHALDLRDSGDIGSFGHNVRRIFSRFWKCYVARRGYREGPYGFLIALCAGLYPILSYLKARLEKE